MFNIKLFKTKEKAVEYAEMVGGIVYDYGADSPTNMFYIGEIEKREGSLDEAQALAFPHMVSWIKKESTQ